jgi:DeoR family fructose operon transcriptional repressor
MRGLLMFAEERKDKIMAMLKRNKRVTVDELVAAFGVTGATIRTDFKELESLGYIIRTHGGAIIRDDAVNDEDSIQERKDKNLMQKMQIAQKAREFIEEGDIIIIDSGTTTFELARALSNAKNITVITNDLKVGLELQKNKEITLILMGGKVRNSFECTVGMTGIRLLDMLTVDKLFMSANAFSITKGATTPNIEQAETKSKMIEISQTAYLLCDSSKMGKRTLCSFATVDTFECIITDNGLAEEDKKRIQQEGTRIIFCD